MKDTDYIILKGKLDETYNVAYLALALAVINLLTLLAIFILLEAKL